MSFSESMLKEDLFRKPSRWTQSSDEITFIHDETDLGRLQNTLEDSPSKIKPRGYQVGLAGPTCRLVDLVGPPVGLSFVRRFSTALKIKSTPLLKVGLIRGSRFDATPYI